MVESRFVEFRLDYSANKDLGVGQFVSSEVVSAGGHLYTDSLPADAELGDSDTIVAMMQHLVAAADRYALDRLKTMCSLKLTENVSADTVGSILFCAETYGCPELKKRCLDFFAVETNFKKAAFTDGFFNLVQKYPLLSGELRRRVGI